MFEGHTIGVVVPAYNEEQLITRVLQTMPEYVDRIIVVDDCSGDRTSQVVEEYCTKCADEGRILLLRHAVNQGVGEAIVTGYRQLLSESVDVALVMPGDGLGAQYRLSTGHTDPVTRAAVGTWRVRRKRHQDLLAR
jgi:glycosyltransferase involved in cell wall biosynthesis